MLNSRTARGAFALSDLAASGIGGVLRNRDGSINWKLIGIIGLGLALLGTLMSYRQERAREKG